MPSMVRSRQRKEPTQFGQKPQVTQRMKKTGSVCSTTTIQIMYFAWKVQLHPPQLPWLIRVLIFPRFPVLNFGSMHLA